MSGLLFIIRIVIAFSSEGNKKPPFLLSQESRGAYANLRFVHILIFYFAAASMVAMLVSVDGVTRNRLTTSPTGASIVSTPSDPTSHAGGVLMNVPLLVPNNLDDCPGIDSVAVDDGLAVEVGHMLVGARPAFHWLQHNPEQMLAVGRERPVGRASLA